MKHLQIMGIAALLCAGPAMAADVGGPAPYTPAFSWAGLYLGAHGGGAWGKTQDVLNPGASLQKPSGGFGGLQLGYNLQNGRLVYGVETDVSFGSVQASWGGATQFDPYYGKDGTSMFGTARGRVGLAIDRLLIYGTGGLAWAQEDHGFGCDAARVVATGGCQNKKGGQAFYVKKSSLDVGYVVGAGTEYALTNLWSVKLEYLYSDFGQNKVDMVDPNYPAARSLRGFDSNLHTVKAGVNFHF